MLGHGASIDQNLILTGYIGPGQMVVARRIAERLRMPFVDFETMLEERVELSGEEMRIRYGEARLKTLESELVSEILLYRGTVIHISGKTLGANYARLSETGPVICVVATLDAVLRRLHLAPGAGHHDPHQRALGVGTPRGERGNRQQPGLKAIGTP